MHTTHPFAAVCLVLAVALAPAVALGALPGQGSWKQVSGDGQFVLVMISPLTVDEDIEHEALGADEIRKIRAVYSQSGLYPNDGTATPLWTVPYHDANYDVFIGPKGEHLILAHDDWFIWSDSFGHVATFYHNGTELASYGYEDLFSSFYLRLPFFAGVDGEAVWFDASTMTLTVRANEGSTFLFDVTSGQVIRQTSPFPKYIAAVLAGLAFAAIMWRVSSRGERDAAGPKRAQAS